MGSKTNPGDFDCYGNALPDEPMFILLGRDPNAPKLVEDWAFGRQRDINNGVRPRSDQPMVDEARRCAQTMREWREANDGAWRAPKSRDPLRNNPVVGFMSEAQAESILAEMRANNE